jgi:transcriptional regulator with XRE-family HTH domain
LNRSTVPKEIGEQAMASKTRGNSRSDMPKVHKLAPSTIVRSEGQRLLLEVGGTLEEIANVTGCKSRSTVLNWKSGNKTPSAAQRSKLFGAFAIPTASWGLLPGTPPEKPNGKASAPISAKAPTTLADCLALQHVIRQARNQEGLLPGERVKLADTEAKILALRHRLERENDLLEDRLVRDHPKWQAVKRAIAKALAAHPVAARSVIEELTRLQM